MVYLHYKHKINAGWRQSAHLHDCVKRTDQFKLNLVHDG